MRKWRIPCLATLALLSACSIVPQHRGEIPQPNPAFHVEQVEETADRPVSCPQMPDLGDNEIVEQEGQRLVLISEAEMDALVTCLEIAAENRQIAQENADAVIQWKGAYNDLIAAGRATDEQVRVLAEEVNACRDRSYLRAVLLRGSILGLVGLSIFGG